MTLHWLRSRFHLVALGAALLLAGVSWIGARQYLALRAEQVESRLAERYARTRVLVAGADLPAGSLLSTASLAARDFPVRYLPSGTARVEDLARVEGQRLLAPMKAGDPVSWSALAGGGDPAFSTQLDPGRRAITFPVDDVNAIAGLLVPGDLIDLLYTERRGLESVVQPLLQNVLVLATGTTTERPASHAAGEPSGDPTGFATVTLSVTPEEAQRIVLAQRAGELTAVLRHPADAVPLPSRPLASSALTGARASARTVPRAASEYVELIVGGARAGGAARVREALDAGAAPARPAEAPVDGAPPSRPAAPPVDAGSVRSRLGLVGPTPR